MIVFVDRAAKKKYSSMFYQKLQDCGVELIKPRIRVNYNDPTFQRYEVFLDYLLKHRKEIDRVITIDLFDTCLQYDPFTTEFRKDQFFLQPEGAKIGSDPYNRAWINCSFNTYKALGANSVSDVNIAEIGTKEIVNGGEQAGGVEEMIKFLRMILKTKNKCQDQGFINFYYYSGLMEKQFNIKVTPLPHGNNLFSAVGILAYKREYTVPRTLTLGEVKVDGKLPALIHQFDRCKSFATLITDACPNTDPPFPDYIRC